MYCYEYTCKTCPERERERERGRGERGEREERERAEERERERGFVTAHCLSIIFS